MATTARFVELKSSTAINRNNYDHYVGFGSRSRTVVSRDGETSETKHFHGSKIAGKVFVHRPTGRLQYFISTTA